MALQLGCLDTFLPLSPNPLFGTAIPARILPVLPIDITYPILSATSYVSVWGKPVRSVAAIVDIKAASGAGGLYPKALYGLTRLYPLRWSWIGLGAMSSGTQAED